MSVSPARGARDIRFTIPDEQGGGTLACTIARGVGGDGRRYRIRRRAVAYEEGAAPRLRETATVWDNWGRGAGFGRMTPRTTNGYTVGTNLYCRGGDLLMPAGELTELNLGGLSFSRFDSAFDFGLFTYLTTASTRILKVTNSGTSVSVADAGVSLGVGGAAVSAAVFGDKAWVANGPLQRMVSFDGSTWAQATDDVRRTYVATANWQLGAQFANSAGLIGTTQRVLVGTSATTTSSVLHCVDDPGLTASWAGPNAVGDSVYAIQRLHAAGEAVFAGKPDGVYLIEGGGRMRNLAPSWRTQVDASNGKALQFFDQFLFAGHTRFLDMISPDPDRVGLQMACHPGAAESGADTPVTPRCTALVVDGEYLLAAFWDISTNNSYLMAGRRADRVGYGDNRNPIIWYGAEAIFTGVVTLLHVIPSNGSGPRWLLIGTRPGYETGTAQLWTQSLPTESTPYDAWKAGGYHRFAPHFTCQFATDDLGDNASPKIMRYVAATTENADTARTLTVLTATDGRDEETQITISEPGYRTAVFEQPTDPGVNVQVTLVGDSGPTEPLVVRSVKVRGTINDERTVVYDVPVVIGRDVVTNRGTRDPSSPFVKRAQLYALLEAGPITVFDWNGVERTMVVEDVSDEEILDDDAAGVTVVAVVTLSVLLALPKYGAPGSVYGISRYG